jgi:hypothetical protein
MAGKYEFNTETGAIEFTEGSLEQLEKIIN